MPEKLLLGINDALELVPLSRTTLYELMASGQLPFVKIGSRRFIPHTALVAFVDGLTGAEAGPRSAA